MIMVTFVRAWFKGLDPFLSIGVLDVASDLSVQLVQMWVSVERGAESFSFNDQSSGDFNDVWYHIRDVTLGNVVFNGGV